MGEKSKLKHLMYERSTGTITDTLASQDKHAIPLCPSATIRI